MATRHTLIVAAVSRDNRSLPPTLGSITKVEWDKKERTENAFKTFGMWFGFTFASVFIPIAHWILVPTLFIASFIFATDKLKEADRNEGGKVECPKCHAEARVNPSKMETQFTDTCNHCHEDLELSVSKDPSVTLT